MPTDVPAPDPNDAWRLLLEAARDPLDFPSTPELTSAALDLDAELFLKLAQRHRLLPLATTVLPPGTLPETLRSSLQQRCFGLAARTSAQLQLLASLRSLFEAAPIRWLCYKGPVLSMDLYEDPMLRPCDDLDLLVHPADIEAAVQLLLDGGYRMKAPQHPAAFREQLRGNWGLEFLSPDTGFLLELKTDLAPRFYSFPTGRLLDWATPRFVEVDGIGYPTLSRELQTLALAAHGGWHCWERLLWIVDFGTAMRKTDDPVALDILARQLGAQRLLALGRNLVERLMHADPPRDCHKNVQRAADWAWKQLPAEKAPVTPLPVLGRFHLSCRERRGDRIRYLWRFLSTSNENDWAVVTLPRPLSPLYRLIRPLRLFVNAAGLLFKRPKGSSPFPGG